MRATSAVLGVLLFIGGAAAQSSGNLLRNGDFQDDWVTFLPETKNHHWCYSSEFTNRRDFNPDCWWCKGSWQWQNADAPAGQRRLILQGPQSEAVQRINWVMVHDDRSRAGFPDAGGFPGAKPQRSTLPMRVVRDLTLRIRLKGQNVVDKAGTIEVAYCPLGDIVATDPLGAVTPASVSASAPIPVGTYDARVLEVKLAAADWLRAVQAAATKVPAEAAEIAKSGPQLPGTALVAVRYKAAAGQVELLHAELVEGGPTSPNLLVNGGFETLDKAGYPADWGLQTKYLYFPPGHYYIFNTWHNSRFDNRGPVQADALVSHSGNHGLKMIVPSGDEKSVASSAIVLNQKEPRLIEVQAYVKTDRLSLLQIDAVTDKGERLDGCNFIHKAPVSVGTNDWRLVRQVFRPRTPVKSLQLLLAARGVNGYTLDDTGDQPQNHVTGTAWWDDVQLFEPESTTEELAARDVKAVPATKPARQAVGLAELDLGERLLGDNVLSAAIANPGAAGTFTLQWEFTSPSGKRSSFRTAATAVAANARVPLKLPYSLTETSPPYSEYHGKLSLIDGAGKPVAASELWFATWTTPIDLELGALYLQPDQKQLVRMNLGLSAATLAKLASIRLDIVRRGTGEVVKTATIPATLALIAAQRDKLPADLREDFSNLLLADLDVGSLPVQPFGNPQRHWQVRATPLGGDGKPLANAVTSQPFCRQAHVAPQPPVQSVAVKGDMLFVNNQPWLPWGMVYGFVPVYDGPADPGAGKYRDLHNLPGWNIYDRFTAEPYSRKKNDFNCQRYVAGSISDPKVIDKQWQGDNLYCSSAFIVPQPVFSAAELAKAAGGKDKLDALLATFRSAPSVVSIAPGIEEAFGLFHSSTPEQVRGMGEAVDAIRKATGKPVMVGHGGYWNRFEFEKIPFFDIYDPETEPFYPGNLHTDLLPLIQGKDKVAWLRPQMYEDVPYERWRFHVFVELMRGARGWQIAHGPGDQSLFRGLHGELEFMKPVVASKDAGPVVLAEPNLERWSRQRNGKLYVIAATTHGMGLGKWRDVDEPKPPAGKARETGAGDELRTETNGYSVDQPPPRGPSIHGVHSLPQARVWPAGTKLVQWARLDSKAQAKNLVVLVRGEGRWTHAASWGKFTPDSLRADPKVAYWFLHSFYRHAAGFLGWDDKLVSKALEYMPAKSADMGPLPKLDEWVKLEVPLDKIDAAKKLVDGVAFLHEDGRVWWGATTLVAPDGAETVIWGDGLGFAPEHLAKTKFSIEGLKAGTKVRVLFEDRELTSATEYFVDDCRGQDLYQRFGGGPGTGYGDTPVALRIYEVPLP